MILNMLIIALTTVLGVGMTIGGALLAAYSYIEKTGYVFEGFVTFALGVMMLMIVLIASTIGKTFMLYNKLYAGQIDMQQLLVDEMMKQKMPKGGLDTLFGGLKPGGNIIIKDLNTGEVSEGDFTGEDAIQKINEVFFSALNKRGSKKELEDMDLKELEKELAKAIKKEDFETAEKINKLIKDLDSKEDDEKKDE